MSGYVREEDLIEKIVRRLVEGLQPDENKLQWLEEANAFVRQFAHEGRPDRGEPLAFVSLEEKAVL